MALSNQSSLELELSPVLLITSPIADFSWDTRAIHIFNQSVPGAPSDKIDRVGVQLVIVASPPCLVLAIVVVIGQALIFHPFHEGRIIDIRVIDRPGHASGRVHKNHYIAFGQLLEGVQIISKS
jgi:hypothetical protein